MARLIARTANAVTTVTFTTSQTWTSPVGVTNLLTVVGRGQDGTAATSDSYGPSTHRHSTVATVVGIEGNAYPLRRSWNWSASQSDIVAISNAINVGGSGSYTANSMTIVYEFTTPSGTCFTYSGAANTVSWTNAIPGSAVTSVDAGWRTSGVVIVDDYGSFFVDWDERGALIPGTAATTGSNTTGFSKTFNGGVGVSATTTTTYNNVAITASTGYSLVVPSGGYITITY